MAFCTKCGIQNEDGLKFCTGCGNEVGAASAPAAPSPIMGDFVAALKGLFSKNPESVVPTAGNAKTHVWAILGGIYLLVIALGAVVLTSQLFPAAMRERFDINLGAVFFNGLISGAINIVVIAGLIKLLLLSYKTTASFVKVLNVVAAATLIYSLAALVGIIFSFINVTAIVTIGAFLPLFGIIACLGLIYKGMKTCEPTVSPIWGWGVIIFAFVAAQLLPLLWDGGVAGGILEIFSALM